MPSAYLTVLVLGWSATGVGETGRPMSLANWTFLGGSGSLAWGGFCPREAGVFVGLMGCLRWWWRWPSEWLQHSICFLRKGVLSGTAAQDGGRDPGLLLAAGLALVVVGF